ncbi:hypothetical protein Tco_0586424 [Tanacetum coccineum]
MKVNTVKLIVNRVRPANVFHKTHSPSSRPFKKTTVLSTNFSKQKVNTAKVNTVSAVGGKRETTVKPSAGCNWRPQRYNWHNDYPHRALKNKGIVDSGCSRHMTRNKAYLAEFQDFNGGPVAFGGSKGYITGKGTKDIIDAVDSEKEDESAQDCFREGPKEEEQVFLDELERLKRQEKDTSKAAKALRKEFAQETENLIIQEGAAKTSRCTWLWSCAIAMEATYLICVDIRYQQSWILVDYPFENVEDIGIKVVFTTIIRHAMMKSWSVVFQK